MSSCDNVLYIDEYLCSYHNLNVSHSPSLLPSDNAFYKNYNITYTYILDITGHVEEAI